MSSVIGGPAYCVMFGAGPPAPHQKAALARYKRTTLAYMGARSQQQAANNLGIRFVGAHTRAVYSRLVTASVDGLSPQELQEAREWGDWGALVPALWVGQKRRFGQPPTDMPYGGSIFTWPYSFMAAMLATYDWSTLLASGLFLDADNPDWWESIARLAILEPKLPLYLNGGRFRDVPVISLTSHFAGLFYEAVQVGASYEDESRTNAERLLEKYADERDFWVGIQVRFHAEPTAEQLEQWSDWFLRVRTTPSQSVTFVVQPAGSLPRELPCPDALDPARVVGARPVDVRPKPVDSEMP